MPKVRWKIWYEFCSKFYIVSSAEKIWESVKIWQSYRELNVWSFFGTQCSIPFAVWCYRLSRETVDSELDEVVQAMIQNYFEPEKNGLIWRKM